MSETRQPVKIFLASSMTLEERHEVPKLILELNKILHGVQIEPVLCDYDAPSGDYGGQRFQDHFNQLLQGCDLALVIFYSKAGDFTLEEMRLARAVCQKTFVYFKTGFIPQTRAENASLDKVFEVKDHLAAGNDLVYKEFATLDKFRDLFKTDLLLFAKEKNWGSPPTAPTQALPRRLFSWVLWEGIFFTGRVPELQRMDEELARPGAFLALVGAGGFGKTSLATQYFLRHTERHPHVVWLFCAGGIRQALLSDSTLQEHFIRKEEQTLSDDARWEIITRHLSELPGHPLLVLDNADGIGEKDHPDCDAAHQLRQRLPNWSILATLRLAKKGLQTAEMSTLSVGRLSDDDARAVFFDACPAAPAPDDALLLQLFQAVGGHALLIELLAKNFQKVLEDDLPHYDLAAFCADLQKNGILDLSKKRSVAVAWHETEGRLDEILDRLYDFEQLDEAQQDLLGPIALLPARPTRVAHLRRLFGIDPDDDASIQVFTEALDQLCRRGWLQFVEPAGQELPAYGLLPVMAELTRRKIAPTVERCEGVITRLRTIIQTENLSQAKNFLEYTQTVVAHVQHLDTVEVAYLSGWTSNKYAELGQIPNAQRFRLSSKVILERLLAANPDAEGLQRDLAVSFAKLGDLASDQGRPEEARRLFEQAFDIRKKLAAANPDAEGLQRELAVSFSKLGDLARQQGRPEEARRLFEQYNAISQKLAAANPDAEGLQRELAVSFSKLGDLASDQGRPEEARRLFEQAFDIRKKLAAANPDAEGLQRDLAVSFSKLGDLASDQGRPEEARRLFEQAFDIRKKLAAANPDAEGLQRDLAVSFSKLGDLASDQGRPEEARRLFEQYNAISQKLAAANPDAEGLQRDLAVSFSKLGDLASDQGRPEEARRLFEQANEVFKKLAAANPDAEGLQRELAVSFSKLGDLASDQGRPEEARRLFEQAFDIRKKLAAANPDAEGLQRDLAVSFSKLGDLASDQGRPEEARRLFEQDLTISEKLAAANPDAEGLQRDLAVSWVKLGDLENQLSRSEAARNYWQQGLTLLETRLTINPGSADLQRLVQRTQERLGQKSLSKSWLARLRHWLGL